MSDLKIQGEVQLSAEGAEAALDRVGDKAGQMATRLQTEAGKAGAAVDGIGSGATKSAAEFSRAEGSIAASIKRATSNLENLGKTASQRLELRIADKGLDPGRFEPLLAKLRELESAQGRVGISAAQTAAAMRSVPAQMTDIIVSLQAGQAPMTVLMQQGGQLKDMFGGAGAAARAIGGYVVGMINPITVAMAAAAGLGYALSEGSAESRRLATALIMTGNAAGTTVGQLQMVAQSVSDATGASRGAVAGVLEQLASTGQVAAANLGRVAASAVAMGRATGQSTEEMVKQFAELGKSPVDAVLKLNDQYRFLTAEVYKQIKALEEQGRTAEAGALAQSTYADAMKERAAAVEANLGNLEKAWRGVKDGAMAAWDAMLNIGRDSTLEKKLADAKGDLASGMYLGSEKDKRWEITVLEEAIAAEKERNRVKVEGNEAEKAGIEWMREGDKWLSKAQEKKRDIAKLDSLYVEAARGAAGDAQKQVTLLGEYQSRLAQINEKYKEKSPATKIDQSTKDEGKAYAQFFEDLAKAEEKAAFAGMEFSDSQKAMNKLMEAPWWKDAPESVKEWVSQQYAAVRAQEQAADATKKQTEWEKQLADYRKKSIASATEEADALIKKAQAAEDENMRIGATTEQLTDLIRKRYDEQIALKRSEVALLKSSDGYKEQGNQIRGQVAVIEQQIDALERLKNAEVARPALQQQAQAWQEFTRDIEQSLTDALMRSFEAGDSFSQAFAKSLQNMFKTMVLKFTVQAIVGGAGQLLGISTSAGAANAFSTVSNMASGAGGLYQLYNGYTAGTGTGMMGSVGNYLGGTGMVGGYYAGSQAAATAVMGEYAGATGASVGGVGVGSMAASGTTAGAAAGTEGALAGMGPYGWMALAALAAFAIFSKSGGGPKQEGGAVRGIDSVGNISAFSTGDYYSDGRNNNLGYGANAGMSDLVGSSLTSIQGYVSSLGGQRGAFGLGLKYNTDPQGNAPDMVATDVYDASGNLYFHHDNNSVNRGDYQKEIANEIKRATIAAVDLADINPIFEAIVHGIDEATASTEQLDAAINSLNAARQAIDLAKLMGMDEASYTALLTNTKDISGLSTAMSTYYASYYPQEKQRQGLMDSMSKQFDKLGVSMPLTRDGFRDLMDSLDLTTTSGRATYNALLALSPQFLAVADAAQQAAQEFMGFDAAGLGKMLLDAAFNPVAGMTAAESFAQSLESSVRQALISSTVGNIATSIYNAIVVPMVAGAAVSDAAINQVVAQAQMAISTLGLVLKGLDLTAITNAARAILPSLQQFAPAPEVPSYTATAAVHQQAAEQAASAIKQEWQSVADAILGTMRELRGEILDDSRNFAAEQARFAMATAAARAGDRSAAEQLPTLARSVVDLGKAVTATAADQALLTAQTLASLRTTVEGIGSQYGVQIPAFAAGGDFGGGLRLVGERGPEVEATGPARIFSNEQLRDALQGGNVAEEVRALREEVRALREANSEENRSIAGHAYKTAKTLERITPDGDAMATRTAA